MKNYLTFIFIILTFTSISHSQMKLGPKVGVNFSNLVGDDAEGVKTKTGFLVGLFFIYQFNDLFAIQPEAYYTMKGVKDEEIILGETAEWTIALDYIEIPILFKVIIPFKNFLICPSFLAGPYVGFNTTAKAKIEYLGKSSEQDIVDLKSTDLGLVFGIGLGFPVGQNEAGVDFRYELGLTTLFDFAEESDLKNSVFSINAYFGFNLH